MEEEVQQRVCIDFCFRLGKTGAEKYEMLQAAFGESRLSRSKTFECYSRFKSGLRSFEDDLGPGRPSTPHFEETVACMREMIRADQRLPIRLVAEEVRIALGTCQKILTEDLHMRRVTAKFVPCPLTAEQKDDRVSICTELRDRALNDPTPSLLP
jgi:histone-lysine N-methyltransferase SETMAR